MFLDVARSVERSPQGTCVRSSGTCKNCEQALPGAWKPLVPTTRCFPEASRPGTRQVGMSLLPTFCPRTGASPTWQQEGTVICCFQKEMNEKSLAFSSSWHTEVPAPGHRACGCKVISVLAGCINIHRSPLLASVRSSPQRMFWSCGVLCHPPRFMENIRAKGILSGVCGRLMKPITAQHHLQLLS